MKKAWLLLVEVVVTIMIIFGFFLFSFFGKLREEPPTVEELDFIVAQVLENGTIRELTLQDPENAEIELGKKINPVFNFTMKKEKLPKDKKIHAATVILWNKEIKRFNIYIWKNV
ncbi:MAG: hypothetical protein NZ889_02410 [Candidatus Pacearchaeota archaeon]|nr:hypothetical protein [Candidatus Pacearchaeota archaeon]